MTSTAADQRETAPKKASVVGHPWFPKVMGLWFAALFGLCSLALAPDVLERIVAALGIDRIVPAAAPPLGQTARLLLAMGMAGVGEIVGLMIGARLAAGRRARSVRPREAEASGRDDRAPSPVLQVRVKDRHCDAPPRRPFSATDDLGAIDDALRRRDLASEPRSEPPPPVAQESLDQAIDGTPVAEPLGTEPAPPAAPAPELPPGPAPFAATAAASSLSVASAPLESLGVVQLSERLALALRARRERQGGAAAAGPLGLAPEQTDRALRAALASLQRISEAR